MQTLGRSGSQLTGINQACLGAAGTPPGHSPARASRLHPKAARGCGTNTSSFSDLFHLITSCDFLGTVHRNEQAAASGHNRMAVRVQLHSPPHKPRAARPGWFWRGVAHLLGAALPQIPHGSFEPLIYYLASSPFCSYPAKCARGKEGSRNIKAEMPLYICFARLAMTN